MPKVGSPGSQLKRRLFLLAYKKYRGNVTKSCETVKIERQTFYDWLNRHPNFTSKIDAINESIIDHVEQQLLNQIDNDNDKLTSFFLERKGKHRGYAKDPEISQTNNLLIGLNAEDYNTIIERAHKALQGKDIVETHNDTEEPKLLTEPR